ncbi:hydrogenase maturation protease [Parasalinivibrio latis]|uniref:hydrogenase maturation protease n=1 Tax=Parasalinivibrio latis TaxID=2952610 RepID=UPI0030DED354
MLHILCFGNSLHGDDGVGPAVAARLQATALPDGARVFDAGVMGLNAMPLFENCSHVLLIDAMDIGLEPGQWGFIEADTSFSGLSGIHGGGVGYLLQAVTSVVSPVPEIAVLGIQIEKVGGFNPVLSDAVTASLDSVTASVTELAGNYQSHAAFTCVGNGRCCEET